MNRVVAIKSIKRNYILSLTYEIFSLLTPLITAPYISRVLGAEGVGVYSYTESIVHYFILFGNLGISAYGQMVIAGVRDNRKQLSKSFIELFLLRVNTMLVSLMVYLIFCLHMDEYRIALFILGFSIIAASFDLSWFYRGIENFTHVVMRNFIIKILTIIMVFILVKEKEDVYLYILLTVLSTFIGNLSFLVPIRKYIEKVPIKELDIFQHVKPTLVFFVPAIATSVYKLLDKTMLGAMTEGNSQNGYYEQAHKIEQLLLISITSLNMIMRSRMTYLYKNKKIAEMKMRIKKSLSYILMISLPMMFGLVAVSAEFIPVFLGDGFEESIYLLQIFAFLLPVIGISNCLSTHYLSPSGQQAKSNYILLMGAIINFICNLILIPRYGAIGAALASVLAESIIMVGFLILSKKFFKAFELLSVGWKYCLVGAAMFLFLQVFPLRISNRILQLACRVGSGAVFYFLILILIRDRYLINSIQLVIRRFTKARE